MFNAEKIKRAVALGPDGCARIQHETVVVGSTLVPKRGRQHDHDPITIVQLWRSDNRAQVHDTSVLLNTPSWRANGRASSDGTKTMTMRELAKHYWVIYPAPTTAAEAVAMAESALGLKEVAA